MEFRLIEMSRKKIPVACRNCSEQTEKTISRYNESIKNGWNFFCSIKCRYAYKEKGEEFFCAWCSKIIIKTPAQQRQTKRNVFCTKSCAAKYNNRNKQTGTRRSKLEQYLEQQIIKHFPSIEFYCNKRKPINLELDFYFPKLKLAIEINGFLHFKPVYGVEKLKRIQKIDEQKAEKCFRMKIDLIIIDVSNEPHLTKEIKDKHWRTVRELITSRIQQNANNSAK